MTTPDSVTLYLKEGALQAQPWGGAEPLQYIRRSPAVLAELPEVRALIRQAVDKAVRIVMDEVGYEEEDLCESCRNSLAAIREGRNG